MRGRAPCCKLLLFSRPGCTVSVAASFGCTLGCVLGDDPQLELLHLPRAGLGQAPRHVHGVSRALKVSQVVYKWATARKQQR